MLAEGGQAMNYYLEISVAVRTKLTSAEFDSAFDAIAEALYDCDGVEDPDLAGDYASSVFTFTMNTLDAAGPEEALAQALAVVRTALHVSGGATPHWEDQFEFMRQTIQAQNFATA